MVSEAIAAYAHYLSIFVTLSCLVAEFVLFRPNMEAATVRLLPRLDLAYLVAVICIIVTGLLRVFFFAKGADYYAANYVFWIKMGLFVIVGLLSLPPTFAFIANRRRAAGGALVLDEPGYRRIRRYIHAELGVFALIPLAAALMARGIGM
jgi:putative membrane protein